MYKKNILSCIAALLLTPLAMGMRTRLRNLFCCPPVRIAPVKLANVEPEIAEETVEKFAVFLQELYLIDYNFSYGLVIQGSADVWDKEDWNKLTCFLKSGVTFRSALRSIALKFWRSDKIDERSIQHFFGDILRWCANADNSGKSIRRAIAGERMPRIQ